MREVRMILRTHSRASSLPSMNSLSNEVRVHVSGKIMIGVKCLAFHNGA